MTCDRQENILWGPNSLGSSAGWDGWQFNVLPANRQPIDRGSVRIASISEEYFHQGVTILNEMLTNPANFLV
jgi:hypothetical protein